MTKLIAVLALLIPAFASAQGQALVIVDEIIMPVEQDAVMGSAANSIGSYLLINHSGKNAIVTDILIFDNTAANSPSFTNLRLFAADGFLLASAADPVAIDGRGYAYQFHLPPQTVILDGMAFAVNLRGDVPNYPSGGAQDNTRHQFQIADPSGVKSFDVLTGTAIPVSAFAYGSSTRVLRSNLTVFNGSTTNIIGNTVTFAAGFTGPVALNKLTVSFVNPDKTPAMVSLADVSLIDPDGNDAVTAGEAVAVSITSDSITWLLNGFAIQAGTALTFTIRTALPVTAFIRNANDVAFADGLDPKAMAGLRLSEGYFPIMIGVN